MLRNWRSWVLLLLFLGPFLAYMGLGFLWLKERGWAWVTIVGLLSILSGVVFGILLERWTKSTRAFLPPIDWDAPQTFTDFDRKAWDLVAAEADQGEALTMNALTSLDTYIDTGRRLATRLAAHYHPLSADPIERVPVIELITALELAAEDLGHLCRQVPGGDLVTPADWKRAVVAAGYIQKASDFYSYLLPLVNPVTGLSRLASQHLSVKPAWRNMQQNLLRWFFRAFVNRLGTHLVELYSGRLVIGASGYRKLTRKLNKNAPAFDPTEVRLRIVLVGRRGAGKSTVLEQIRRAQLPTGVAAPGTELPGLARLRDAQVEEIDFYTATVGKESARDRATRQHAVRKAVDSDLLVLVVDARASDDLPDRAFAEALARWYIDHPEVVAPPALAVVMHLDGLAEGAVRDRINTLRVELPPSIGEIVPGVAPGAESVLGGDALAAVARFCDRAERGAVIRQIRQAALQSRTGRLLGQVGEHGRSLWTSIRRGRARTDAAG